MRAFVIVLSMLGLLAGAARAPAQQLAGGGGHTCAATPGGTLMCWGWDEQGQLGDSAQNYSWASPVLAEGIAGASAVDAGYGHSCAITTAGVVKCWGYNRWGQIGSGNGNGANTGITVAGIGPATAIGTGGHHSCARLADATVWCWGHGYHGQLGTGTFIETNVPVQVNGVTGATAIAVGDYHSCAIVGTGSIKCWGRNDYGQLGNGGTNPDPGLANAVDVFGISDAIAISAGSRHTCALRTGQSIACWGNGGYGTLGNGLGQDSPAPVDVSGIGNAIALVAGDHHNCALRSDHTMSCWGYNYFGTVGDGSNRNNHLLPQNVVGLNSVTAIAAGSEHTCARVSENPINVKCWGHGSFGQLGDGQIGGAHETPLPVFVLGGPFDVVFGGNPGNFE
jgi:alpha-tubulin suppressor-like RCC1 family protein